MKALLKIFFVVCLVVAAFLIGRYSSQLYWLTVDNSFHVGAYRNALERIRSDQKEEAIKFLEMQLDMCAVLLADQQKVSSILKKLFVPHFFRLQTDRAISGFIKYRKTIAKDYKGVDLVDDTKDNSVQVLRANRNRKILNNRVAEILKSN